MYVLIEHKFSKISDNLDFNQNFRKISILVKIFDEFLF